MMERKSPASSRKDELRYLKCSLPSTVPSFETKQIPLNLLKDIQGEHMTRQQHRANRPKGPVVLKLRRPVIDTSLNCFLETKANFSYRHRLRSQVPRFGESGPMVVKVYPLARGGRYQRRSSLATPRQSSGGLIDEFGKLLSLTPKDIKTITTLEFSLTSTLNRQYLRERLNKTMAERFLESKVFQVR